MWRLKRNRFEFLIKKNEFEFEFICMKTNVYIHYGRDAFVPCYGENINFSVQNT